MGQKCNILRTAIWFGKKVGGNGVVLNSEMVYSPTSMINTKRRELRKWSGVIWKLGVIDCNLNQRAHLDS